MLKNNQTKKYLSFLVLLIVIVGCMMVWHNHVQQAKVYFRVVTPEDGPALSEGMTNWIAEQKETAGVHAYGRSDTGFYELLLLDNRHTENNLYLHTVVQTWFKNGVLYVNLTDKNAMTESDARYNEEHYFILKEKPLDIQVVVNDKPYKLIVQNGEMQITE